MGRAYHSGIPGESEGEPMVRKFRIWTGGKMIRPEDLIKSTYRYLLNADGVVFGIDLHDMKWDGMMRIEQENIMPQIGKKDMDGQEIYEGDVVKTRDWEDGRRWLIGTVEYDEEDCGYSINFDTGDPKHEGLAISFMASPDCKVLGHKHQDAMQKLIREQRERFTDPGREAAFEQTPTEKAV